MYLATGVHGSVIWVLVQTVATGRVRVQVLHIEPVFTGCQTFFPHCSVAVVNGGIELWFWPGI